MKKLTTYLFVLLLAVTLGACSDDMTSGQAGSGARVSYTLTLGEDVADATRAYADGTTAKYLSYGVYKNGVLIEKSIRETTFNSNLTATIDLSLVRDNTYQLVFWADAGEGKCPYTVDFDAHTVTMDYAGGSTIVANSEERDVFWASEEVCFDESSLDYTVTLYRPLAQVNVGTDDLQTEFIMCRYSAMDFALTVPAGVPTTFDLFDGSVGGETTSEFQFVTTGLTTTEAFPVSDDYGYLLMNYVLAPEDKYVFTESAWTFTATHDEIPNDIVVEINNMPYQRNWRTNILGSLLTKPDEYIITIDPIFEGDYELVVTTDEGNNIRISSLFDGDNYFDDSCITD